MATLGPTAAEREKEKMAHSILYKESTSEIKDDIVQLLECWKGGGQGKGGSGLGRTEAGFLLWYHALNAKETHGEMFENGAVGSSIAVLDIENLRASGVSDTERTIAASLLRLLVEEEEYRDKFLSAKSTTGSGFEVLSDALGNLAVGQERVAGVLRVLAESPRCRSRIINNFSPLNWRHFLGVLEDPLNRNEASKVQTAFFLRYLVMGRDDLKAEVAAACGARALLQMLRASKTESAINAATGCLMRMAEEDSFLQSVAEQDGIKPLADVIAPPPHFFVLTAIAEQKRRAEEEENRRVGLERQREQLHEAVKFREEQRQTQRQKETKEREKEQGRSRPEDGRAKSAVPMKTPRRTVGGGVGGGNATTATSGAGSQTGALPRLSSNMSTAKPKKLGARRGTMQASNLPPLDEDKAAVEMPKIDVRYLPTEHARPLVPDADALPPHDVGHSSLRISWERHLSVQTRGYACAILYNLSLEDRYCVVIDSCAVTFRLCQFLNSILTPPPPPTGKKGKKEKKGKKGKAAKLKLTPEEENAVVAICGCLRHLTTLSDTNKARIVKYGAVPGLVQLYRQSTRNKIRWNCRGVLNEVGCLSENGEALQATGVFPEEFLVYDAMHLRKSDLSILQAEFRAEEVANQAKAKSAKEAKQQSTSKEN